MFRQNCGSERSALQGTSSDSQGVVLEAGRNPDNCDLVVVNGPFVHLCEYDLGPISRCPPGFLVCLFVNLLSFLMHDYTSTLSDFASSMTIRFVWCSGVLSHTQNWKNWAFRYLPKAITWPDTR